ncbi:MAG: hypothetical protein HY934_04915 [Candidatus Firestonebacteria bacterium]|nr:hypothetical protein [Candidatus Firestonebacteria bacterium]
MTDIIVNSVRKTRESIFKIYKYDLKNLYEHEKENYKKIIKEKKMRRGPRRNTENPVMFIK